MNPKQYHVVELEDQEQRIDRYLAELLDISRSKIAQYIKEEHILVNQLPIKASYLIEVDDEIEIEIPREKQIALEPVKMDLDIIYEDEDLMIINKPKGLVVHPGAGTVEPTLVHGLLAHTRELSMADDPIRPGIVHRLDKDTSGLLVVAKNQHAHQFLAKQLAEHLVVRKYLAIVYGEVTFTKAKVDAPIGRDPNFRQKMAVTEKNSKHAITHLTALQHSTKYSLLECALETGRTHQIRVHCAYINHPLVGDKVYGPKKGLAYDGQLLHAYQLQLTHPTTGQWLTFEAQPPLSFDQFLQEVK
ncbi:MAG TPA: RluA family pseudouridine synthase [Erysipelothrix sp.]|nr:RluA family pseudouridine synthase [Erysipelothrix sp.]